MSNYQVTPYLAAHDGRAALDFYTTAFGAVEVMKVIMDDGRLGHSEFRIGQATFYLSDEFPEIGVVSPRTLGGTTLALHLTVPDVDGTFARAVAAGATALSEPADQPHGSRHGTLVDPFGHRWMVSQPIENVSMSTYAERVSDSGVTVETNPAPAHTSHRSGNGSNRASRPAKTCSPSNATAPAPSTASQPASEHASSPSQPRSASTTASADPAAPSSTTQPEPVELLI